PDFVISLDDDNYCTENEDAFAEHAVTCISKSRQKVWESSTGFLNICNLLEFERVAPVYARGFPYKVRHVKEEIQSEDRDVPVHINAGLWQMDPDVDGITWLVAKPNVTGFKGPSVVLGRNTWSPVNTQN